MGINNEDNWGDPVEIQPNSLVGINDLYMIIGEKELELLNRSKMITALQNAVKNIQGSVKDLELKLASKTKVESSEVDTLRKQVESSQLSASSLSAKNIKLGDRVTELLKEIEILKVENASLVQKSKAKKKKK